jgi:hypothetical protein
MILSSDLIPDPVADAIADAARAASSRGDDRPNAEDIRAAARRRRVPLGHVLGAFCYAEDSFGGPPIDLLAFDPNSEDPTEVQQPRVSGDEALLSLAIGLDLSNRFDLLPFIQMPTRTWARSKRVALAVLAEKMLDARKVADYPKLQRLADEHAATLRDLKAVGVEP